MSISSALSNAVSGLAMNARGTETVANNIANMLTEGYARREMNVASQVYTGGVRVTGIARVVNTALVAETRNASGAQVEAETRAAFLQKMESLVGLTGEANALGSAFVDLRRRSFQRLLVPTMTCGCQTWSTAPLNWFAK